jgi:hypothetical protein
MALFMLADIDFVDASKPLLPDGLEIDIVDVAYRSALPTKKYQMGFYRIRLSKLEDSAL